MTTPSTPNIDLNPHDLAEVQRILKQYAPQYEVWAFGSRVTWTAKAYSDLDLAIITDKPLSLGTVADLKNAFDESDLSIKVDLVDWATTGEAFREIIKKTAVVLHSALVNIWPETQTWPSASIQNVAEKVAMGPFGSSIKVDTFVPDGIPVISGQHLKGTRLEDNEYNFISLEHANKLANANVKRGDVIFTHAGNIGQAAYIPESSRYERYIISQRQFYLRPDKTKIIPEFLAYYFASPDGQHKLLANASSSGVPSIAQPVSYLRTIEIPLPPLSEQRAIAHILGTLDDKIELNRRMNDTLEAMARALFKSWFVDFEPVRAKAEGRDTGLPKEIADLFPDSFEDSELGEIPKGWRVGTLPDFIEVNPSRLLRKGEVAPYLDMANVPTNTARANEIIEREFGSGTKFKNGDTLLARITPCLENGKTAFVDFLNDGQIGWGSTEFIVLRPKSPLPPEFGYLLARDEAFRTFAISNMTGTSGRQRVPSDCFSNYVMVVPPQGVADAFGHQVVAIMQKIKGNDEESRTLTSQRDALLPKLLSGEVRVSIKN